MTSLSFPVPHWKLVPQRVVVAGIGCRRDTPASVSDITGAPAEAQKTDPLALKRLAVTSKRSRGLFSQLPLPPRAPFKNPPAEAVAA